MQNFYAIIFTLTLNLLTYELRIFFKAYVLYLSFALLLFNCFLLRKGWGGRVWTVWRKVALEWVDLRSLDTLLVLKRKRVGREELKKAKEDESARAAAVTAQDESPYRFPSRSRAWGLSLRKAIPFFFPLT